MRALRLALLLCFVVTAAAQDLAITGATIFDGTGAESYPATVLVRNGRIEKIDRGPVSLAGLSVIHAEGLALLPGLFDLHTHLTASGSAAPGDWAKSAKAYLLNGITTVDEFGTYPETYAAERAILPTLPGPHVNFAARITTPGGHGAEAGRGDFFSLEVLSPREGRAAVQRVLPYHPDVIKIFTDGWRYGTAPEMTSMDEATIAAIVDEAHKNQLPCLTHTVTLARAKMAARASVDVIAHGIQDVEIDGELLALMQQHGTTYVPTMAVYEPKGARAGQPSERWEHLRHTITAVWNAGIPIALGTDAGMPGTPHGTASLHEMELLVSAGLTPSQALVAGTANSAKALRLFADRGTIEVGKRADFVLVEGEPWRNIADVRRTKQVIVDGRVIDRDRLAREIAQPGPTPLPSRPAARLIDDCERPDDRTSLGTLRIDNTDAGSDHSQIVFQTFLRAERNRALSIVSRMSIKDKPFTRVLLPLSPGAVEPVDAGAFHGIRFDVRGDGDYNLVVPSRADSFSAPFTGEAKWRNVRVPFAELKGKGPWTGADLIMIGFETARPAGEKAWLEIDNVEFY